MNDLIITLPCGFTIKYNEIFNEKEKFTCPFCKNHLVITQECLNLPKNKLLINEKKFELKKKYFTNCIHSHQVKNIDPKSAIDNTYKNLENQIDLRREQIKLIMEQKIDDYYENLLEIIENEKNQILNEYKEQLEKISSFEKDLNNLIIDHDTDIKYKLDRIKNYSNEIDKAIRFLISENKLNSTNWVFNQSDDHFKIEDIFGNLEWQETANKGGSHSSNDEIENQNQGDFCFLINNFSSFIVEKNSEKKSRIFKAKDLKWFAVAKINEDINKQKNLEIYLYCQSVINSDKISVNVDAELELLSSNEITKINYKIKGIFDKNSFGWGFDNFLSINKIFLDFNDRVSIQIKIFSAEIIHKNSKPLINKKARGTVKWYKKNNGYGFITHNDTNEKIFIHKSEILNKNQIKAGDQVEFDIVQKEKGLEAENLTVLDRYDHNNVPSSFN